MGNENSLPMELCSNSRVNCIDFKVENCECVVSLADVISMLTHRTYTPQIQNNFLIYQPKYAFSRQSNKKLAHGYLWLNVAKY
ncbi:jg7911 [Pararge aegeria aegeria]|uniref:Jg7911 protein n=1 Tax=Pararge aegeria aegeria TaxID=348720 RepID=A0A8S4R7B4_9NEOP|nr:jg7911 [Pararge aegeria aegeria]